MRTKKLERIDLKLDPGGDGGGGQAGARQAGIPGGSLSCPSLRQGLCLPDLILAPHLPFNPSLNLTFPSVNGDNNNNIFVV